MKRQNATIDFDKIPFSATLERDSFDFMKADSYADSRMDMANEREVLNEEYQSGAYDTNIYEEERYNSLYSTQKALKIPLRMKVIMKNKNKQA